MLTLSRGYRGFWGLAVIVMAVMPFIASANPLFNQPPPSGGAPTQSQDSRLPPTCQPALYDTMRDLSYLGAQRDIELAQRVILKPDSVLEFTCFNNEVVVLSQTADLLFSDNVLGSLDFGTGTRRFISEPQNFNPPTPPVFDQSNLDRSLNNVVTQVLIGYLSGSFSHSFGGGVIQSVNAGQNCGSMNAVWNVLKCENADPDFFLKFEDFASTDLRLEPQAVACQPSTSRNTRVQAAIDALGAAETLLPDF